MQFFIFVFDPLVILISCMIILSPFLDVIKDDFVNKNETPESQLSIFVPSPFCNDMPCSGCSALRDVNPNKHKHSYTHTDRVNYFYVSVNYFQSYSSPRLPTRGHLQVKSLFQPMLITPLLFSYPKVSGTL